MATPSSGELLIGGRVPDATHEHRQKTNRREQARAVRRFAFRAAIFLVPLFIFVAAIEGILWRDGEIWPLERVIRYQEKHRGAFFGRMLIDDGTFRYKYLQIVRRRPEVLVLGSSRVMQFRAEMFGGQGRKFYNAGGIIHSLDDLDALLKALPPDYTPRVVILGVDFWWLNPNDIKEREPDDLFSVGVHIDGVGKWQAHASAVASYLSHSDAFPELFSYSFGRKRDPAAIGLEPLVKRAGFRIDGSKRFDLTGENAFGRKRNVSQKARAERDIFGVHAHFNFTPDVSPQLRDQLRNALAAWKARGAFIIAFNPPLRTEWAAALNESDHHRRYWEQYHAELPELMGQIDIPFFDIVTPQTIGLDDNYMRDLYHAHDTFDMALLRFFCQQRPEIAAMLPEVTAVADQSLKSPKTEPLYLDLPGVNEIQRPLSPRQKKRRGG